MAKLTADQVNQHYGSYECNYNGCGSYFQTLDPVLDSAGEPVYDPDWGFQLFTPREDLYCAEYEDHTHSVHPEMWAT